MDSPRTPLPAASEVTTTTRRRTTTIKLLDYLTSFSENVDPSLRGTEDDPHLSFVSAIQANYLERITHLERDVKGRNGVSMSALISGLSSETSKSLTTNDLARYITRSSDEQKRNVLEPEIAARQELLRHSRELSTEAMVHSVQGREHFLAGRIEEARASLKHADDLFREAVMTLRQDDKQA